MGGNVACSLKWIPSLKEMGGSMREGKDNGGCAGVVDRGGHSGDEHV